MTSYSLKNNKGEPIDLILNNIFKNIDNGFFIELGAHNGLTQSNTAFFEFNKKWRGY